RSQIPNEGLGRARYIACLAQRAELHRHIGRPVPSADVAGIRDGSGAEQSSDRSTKSNSRDVYSIALVSHLLCEYQSRLLLQIVPEWDVDQSLNVGRTLHLLLLLQEDRYSLSPKLREQHPQLKDHILSRAVCFLVGMAS